MQLEERSIVVRAEGCRLMYGAGVKAGGRSRRAEATMSIPINNGCTNGSASTKACKSPPKHPHPTHTHKPPHTQHHPPLPKHRTRTPTRTRPRTHIHIHTYTHIHMHTHTHTHTDTHTHTLP